MDTALIPKGVKRCPVWQFALWIAANGAVLAWGVFAMLLVYIKGLNQTNMNNAYGFALWIWADLAVIALGGGAFFTGFLRYLVGTQKYYQLCRAHRVHLLQFGADDPRF
jgi:molybdopterin-containing oxidoreductase family membrane subunit